jgi:hypothetical protein
MHSYLFSSFVLSIFNSFLISSIISLFSPSYSFRSFFLPFSSSFPSLLPSSSRPFYVLQISFSPPSERPFSVVNATGGTSFYCILQRYWHGRAIAQAVSRRLPTAAVRGSKPDLGMWDFVMDRSGAGAGFLRELRFPLPIYIPSALHNHLHYHPRLAQ